MAPKKKVELPDDTEHALFYKSPGPHSGGGLRTFDVLHVETDAAAEEALGDGWFSTLPEAYEAAGVKLPKVADAAAKGKPAAPEDEEKDPISGDPLPPKDAPKATLEEVTTALTKLNARDPKAVKAILKKFNIAALPKLKPAQYADFLAATNAALKE